MAGLFSKPPTPKAAAQTPAAPQAENIAPAGTTPEQYQRQQTAFWQNMMAGLGQGTEGGALPGGIQQNIERQAALLQ